MKFKSLKVIYFKFIAYKFNGDVKYKVFETKVSDGEYSVVITESMKVNRNGL